MNRSRKGCVVDKEPTSITHVEFARIASFIASNAASWAADVLVLPENHSEPMRQESIDRFTAKINEFLGFMNEKR